MACEKDKELSYILTVLQMLSTFSLKNVFHLFSLHLQGVCWGRCRKRESRREEKEKNPVSAD